MVQSTTHTKHDRIHAALKKLKNESNAKELELLELVASIYESLKDKQDQTVEKFHQSAGAINTSVHMHPWCYIGGAALAGFITAFIFRR
jgi:ElaB/YqjD/DUF883 family membrane-anchored ribosome-binding protein